MLWKLFLFSPDRGSNITLLELTNQVALLKYFSAVECTLKIYFKKNHHFKRPIYGGVLILYHPLLLRSMFIQCASNASPWGRHKIEPKFATWLIIIRSAGRILSLTFLVLIIIKMSFNRTEHTNNFQISPALFQNHQVNNYDIDCYRHWSGIYSIYAFRAIKLADSVSLARGFW